MKVPPPQNPKEVQKLLGHLGYYREGMEDYATSSISLSNLIRKSTKFIWSLECQVLMSLNKRCQRTRY